MIESPPTNVPFVKSNEWIALIERTPDGSGNCSFELKVYHAQKAGFKAVIIYNSNSDSLIKMSSSGLFSIHIPSVFIGHSSGVDIENFYTYTNKTYVIIDSDGEDFKYLMIPFVIVVSTCFLIGLVIFVNLVFISLFY
jgi:hypothetical protein